MFLNTNILKKLMEQAYKGAGLYVANNGEWITIGSSYWSAEIRWKFLPRKILAKIIELAGDVPKDGDCFKITKEDVTEDTYAGTGVGGNYSKTIEVTKLLLLANDGIHQRILQDGENTHLINNAFIAIVDNSQVDEANGEYKVDKPFYDQKHGILWKNNVAKFHAHWRIDYNHERLLEELAVIDLTEDVPE